MNRYKFNEPRVFDYARRRKDWVKNLRDRRAWIASIRDAVNSIHDADSTRPR